MYSTKARHLSELNFLIHIVKKKIVLSEVFVINFDPFKKSNGTYIQHVQTWVYYIVLYISVNNSEKLIIIINEL
jgi:hypothetical protein